MTPVRSVCRAATAAPRARQRPLAVALLVLALTATACSASKHAASPTTTGGSGGTTSAATPAAAGFTPFFLKGGQVSPGHRRPMPTTDPLGTALRTLIAGTDAVDVAAGLSNAVAKTVVIDSVSQQGHVAVVDFGRKFESANTRPQVGQVVYTLTQFPGIDQVQFLIDGQPNGATGVPPWSRGDLADMTPAILVLNPAPADQLATSFACQGLTQLTVPMACAVLDAAGHRVATTSVAGPTTTSTTTTVLGVAGSLAPGSVQFNLHVQVTGTVHGPASVVVGPAKAGAGTPLASVAVTFG
jgi:hypothetical protein